MSSHSGAAGTRVEAAPQHIEHCEVLVSVLLGGLHAGLLATECCVLCACSLLVESACCCCHRDEISMIMDCLDAFIRERFPFHLEWKLHRE